MVRVWTHTNGEGSWTGGQRFPKKELSSHHTPSANIIYFVDFASNIPLMGGGCTVEGERESQAEQGSNRWESDSQSMDLRAISLRLALMEVGSGLSKLPSAPQ